MDALDDSESDLKFLGKMVDYQRAIKAEGFQEAVLPKLKALVKDVNEFQPNSYRIELNDGRVFNFYPPSGKVCENKRNKWGKTDNILSYLGLSENETH